MATVKRWRPELKRSTYVVAVRRNSLCEHYAAGHVDGYYTTWNVTVTWGAPDSLGSRIPQVTNVRLRAVNVDRPSAKAIKNYDALHEEGLV